jgi:hypothetical protein
MGQLINVLAVDWTQREIPWAGIAAVLAGAGSLLSGIAAYRIATRRNNEPKSKNGNGNN